MVKYGTPASFQFLALDVRYRPLFADSVGENGIGKNFYFVKSNSIKVTG